MTINSIIFLSVMLFSQENAVGAEQQCIYETYGSWGIGDRSLIYYSYEHGPAELYRIDISTGVRQRLTNDNVHQWFPIFSNRGDKVAFVSDAGFRERFAGTDVFSANIDRVGLSTEKRLTDLNKNEIVMHLDWSPEDDSIVYHVRNRETRRGKIWLVATDGSVPRLLSRDPESSDMFPSFSKDGHDIVFVAKLDGISNLYVMDMDGGNRRILADLPGDEMQPRFSPDGKHIAFVSNLTGTRGANDIFVIDSDGRSPRQLTFDESSDHNPIWSRDGTRIAYTSYRYEDVADIFVMRTDGSGPTNITLSSLDCPESADTLPN